jgi:hypothetical protein
MPQIIASYDFSIARLITWTSNNDLVDEGDLFFEFFNSFFGIISKLFIACYFKVEQTILDIILKRLFLKLSRKVKLNFPKIK